MKEINYTFIIPHKNIPELLQRCLNSIPRRDDVQIIIVDDNSDPEKVDFENFPGLSDSYVEVYFTREGKGAGYARNIGLSYAKGKWVLFADSDDYFSDNLLYNLDLYKCKDFDIIFFGCDSKDSITMEDSNRHLIVNYQLKYAVEKSDVGVLRYNRYEVWAKMFSRSFLQSCSCKFQEVIASNDVWFSIQTGYKAEKIAIDYTPIYVITTRRTSLIYTKTKEVIECRYNVMRSVNNFLYNKKLGRYRYNTLIYIVSLFIRYGTIRSYIKDYVKSTPYNFILCDICDLFKKSILYIIKQ